jgi:hypothetical protein
VCSQYSSAGLCNDRRMNIEDRQAAALIPNRPTENPQLSDGR